MKTTEAEAEVKKIICREAGGHAAGSQQPGFSDRALLLLASHAPLLHGRFPSQLAAG
jgi:hypothetical protein